MVIVITISGYKKIAGDGTPDQRTDIGPLGLGYFLEFFVIGLRKQYPNRHLMLT
jgi:hypothetical protein